MIETLKIILLSIIYAITAVLPTSSLGHFALLKEVLGYTEESFNASFYCAVFSLGAGLAMYVYYFGIHKKIIRNLFCSKKKITTQAEAAYRTAGKNTVLSLIALTVLFIPLGKLGFLSSFDKYFLSEGSLIFVGIASLFCAVLMFISLWYIKSDYAEKSNLLSSKNAVFFGIYQLPAYIFSGLSHISVGVSRTSVSDINIKTALKETYLYIAPAFIITGAIRALMNFGGGEGIDLIAAVIGFALSFVISILVLTFINKYFSKKTYKAFALYTLAFAVIVIGTSLYTMLA